MDWDRDQWNSFSFSETDENTGRYRHSSIKHTFQEIYSTAPISSDFL